VTPWRRPIRPYPPWRWRVPTGRPGRACCSILTGECSIVHNPFVNVWRSSVPAVRQRMSRKGNCRDNACAGTFFKTLKRELETLDGRHSAGEVRQSVFRSFRCAGRVVLTVSAEETGPGRTVLPTENPAGAPALCPGLPFPGVSPSLPGAVRDLALICRRRQGGSVIHAAGGDGAQGGRRGQAAVTGQWAWKQPPLI
jgi:hypothetical protein